MVLPTYVREADCPLPGPRVQNQKIFFCQNHFQSAPSTCLYTTFSIKATFADLQPQIAHGRKYPFLTPDRKWLGTGTRQPINFSPQVHRYPHKVYFGLGNPAHQSLLEPVRPYAKNKKSRLLIELFHISYSFGDSKISVSVPFIPAAVLVSMHLTLKETKLKLKLYGKLKLKDLQISLVFSCG